MELLHNVRIARLQMDILLTAIISAKNVMIHVQHAKVIKLLNVSPVKALIYCSLIVIVVIVLKTTMLFLMEYVKHVIHLVRNVVELMLMNALLAKMDWLLMITNFAVPVPHKVII